MGRFSIRFDLFWIEIADFSGTGIECFGTPILYSIFMQNQELERHFQILIAAYLHEWSFIFISGFPYDISMQKKIVNHVIIKSNKYDL